MITCIRKVASEEFGVTQGGKRKAKETWWWNEKVQNTIKEKKRKSVLGICTWIGVRIT
jgi:GMP synthase-like glutamine amidotransferase